MFQSLRESSPFYILYKKDPKLVVGEVVSVSSPVPQFNDLVYQAGAMMPPKNTVDVKVNADGTTMDFQKLPADLSIADFGPNGIVVSESRDAVINEIIGFKKNSEKVIAGIDRHEHIVAECNRMLADLNPQIKREVEQAEDIDNLKKGLADLRNCIADMKGMLSQALGQN